jgi:hypothetical protein
MVKIITSMVILWDILESSWFSNWLAHKATNILIYISIDQWYHWLGTTER